MKILLIGGDPALPATLGAAIRRTDLEIVECETPEEARDRLASEDVAVAILDLNRLESLDEAAISALCSDICTCRLVAYGPAARKPSAGVFASVEEVEGPGQLLETVQRAIIDHLTETLRAGEGQLRLITDNLQAFIAWVGPDQRYRFANPHYAKLFDKTAEQIVGSRVRQVVGESAYSVLEDKIRRALAGETVTFEEWVPVAQGELRCLQACLVPNTTADEKVDGFHVLAFDVTSQKHSEERETQLGRIVEESNDEVLLIDAVNLRFLAANRGSRENLGYTLPELQALQADRVVQSGSPGGLQESLSPLLEGEAPTLRLEASHRRQDGSQYPVEASFQLSRFGSRVVFVEFARDIGERRRAEAALRESERRYRSLFEESPHAIFVSTPEGRILDANPAAARLFGYERSEFPPAYDLYQDPADRDHVLKAIQRDGFVDSYEMALKTRLGEKLTVLTSTSPVHDEEGRITHYRAILTDVTEQRRLEHQLRQSQKMEAIGQLAGGVAHDFNNLLTAINGYSELGLQTLEDDHPLGDYLREILKAGEAGASIVRQLLAFGRRQVLRPTVLDLNGIIRDFENLLRRTLGDDIELKTELASDLDSVRVDGGQIDQVLMNLAVNARDAMPDGGELVFRTENYELEPRDLRRRFPMEQGRYVLLTVRDTGSGMDQRTLARVFDPFFSTKRDAGGTGLGLSMVYGIIKQSKGYVFADSDPGRGTVFELYLPSVDGAGREDPIPGAETLSSPQGDVNGSESILLVEDNEGVRDYLTQILQARGYRVESAGEPARALEISSRWKRAPNLLITDLVMPGMSGVELADRLATGTDTRVIYMSGHTDHALITRGDLPRHVPLLTKPFKADVFLRTVRSVLDSDAAQGA